MDRPDVFVGSIDQGTTSTRFLIFNKAGELVVSRQVDFTQIYPNPGWHEQDPLEIVSSVETCIEEAVTKLEARWLSRSDIKAVGITNQRETTIVWDSETGEPLYNAIVWTDTRSQDIVDRLKQESGASRLQQICGLPLSTYSSSSKLLWMLENVPRVQKAYERGTLAFGTVDAWLVYRLNGGPKRNVFVSDPTNASRTMFMNLQTLRYDDYLLDFFGIKGRVHLPKIVRSSDTTAYGTLAHGALAGTPITGCLGDQSAALVGQKGFSRGTAKNTYGTGCFLLCNVGETPVISSHGLLATVAYHFDGKPVYALEGSIAVGGSGIKFLQNNLEFFKEPAEVNDLALTVENNGGCVFVTAFSGLFAPYWIDDARGTIFGITQYTQKGHLARAILEATCFQTKAILAAMEKDSGRSLTELAVDGGMSNSDLAMQIQADLISIPVYRPQMRETTALGAAIAAGLAAGVWRNFTELREINRASGSGGTVFEPRPGCREESARAFALWEKAVATSRGWVGDDRHHRGAGELKPAASSPDNVGVDLSSDVNGLVVGGQNRVSIATATATATSPSKAMGEVRQLQVSLVGSTSADLEGADEEDLCLELRRVEILQRLRKVRRAKVGVL
ncbi:glycerol kinase [Aspergillus aculeatinus CBS 121060]|uniref:Glycerol kinase n=1 Tax=Aspergillus aculeatinus CBS 121060 TaxID=1448322 RepID=A0ACD1HI82_9EURO|nr:glycerol kinase [Aspergillus aculeatinus CBS 121060]RAH73353.1 glycerol kinase [Aspergillus aculeatinus CBS 121060]